MIRYRHGGILVVEDDCMSLMAELDENSIDAIVTDPPYGLAFMGKGWDTFTGNEFQAWTTEWATAALHVLKPGGHLLAFGGSRTGHRLACGIEGAGFEIRDTITWLYGSGFPKSHDISKAIDKAAGATRGRYARGAFGGSFSDDNGTTYGTALDNTAITDDARFWQGWGTALKPGYEPIVVARKPFKGPVAANVLAYGTGALNIDGTRVAGTLSPAEINLSGRSGVRAMAFGMKDESVPRYNTSGRWPANVVLSHLESCSSDVCTPGCPVAELDMQSGVTKSSADPHRFKGGKKFTGRAYASDAYSLEMESGEAAVYGDTGGASRFFPTFRWQAKAPTRERPKVDDVAHPTVKPLALMQWLTRLVTPPGGLVLDPFAGSGTTVEACIREGFNCLAVEKSPEYIPLIIARIERTHE